MELEVAFRRQVINASSPLNTIVPKDQRRIFLTHILSYSLLKQPDVQFRFIRPRGAFLQSSKLSSNIIAELLQVKRHLFTRHVHHKSIWGTNLLGKLLNGLQYI